MKTPDVRGVLVQPGSDLSSFFLRTLTEAGSVNLALAISTEPASIHMVREIRKATHGLLTLNAVFVEATSLRFLRANEEERFQKDWGLPIRWLRMEKLSRYKTGHTCPPSFLSSLLAANGISCLLASDPKVLSWLTPVHDVGWESFPDPTGTVIQSLTPSDLRKDR